MNDKLKMGILKIFQVLMFDSMHGRTCLHYAAYYGHSDCLQAILSAAHSNPVADSWCVFWIDLLQFISVE